MMPSSVLAVPRTSPSTSGFLRSILKAIHTFLNLRRAVVSFMIVSPSMLENHKPTVLGVGREPSYGLTPTQSIARQIYSTVLYIRLFPAKNARGRIRTFVGHSPSDLQSDAFDRSATRAYWAGNKLKRRWHLATVYSWSPGRSAPGCVIPAPSPLPLGNWKRGQPPQHDRLARPNRNSTKSADEGT